MSEIAAVVVTHDRKELLRKCLKSLLAQSMSCDIIVIDNASSDGTQEMMRENFSLPAVSYHNTGKNLGGSGGFAYGLQKAAEAGYSYAWLMDDDTIPGRHSLEMLCRADRILKGEWGILSSVVRWTDGSICRANRQKKTLFTFVKDKELKERRLIRVRMVSMVSLFVKISVIREMGLPKSEYFIWSDDYDLSGRISKRYPLYVVTKSIVCHAMKENKKADIATATQERIDRYRYLFRNDVDCYRQFGMTGWIYILLKDILATWKVLLYSKKNRGKRILMIWKGFREGLAFHPTIRRIG